MSDAPLLSRAGWLADLHRATTFLTRVPLPHRGCGDGGFAPAMRTFPVVGALIGAASGAVFWTAAALLPPLAAALLALLASVLVTGALHEDGLADLADGLGARGDRDRRLAVMRDSRTGAFGVLALVFSIGLRAAALAAAPSGAAGMWALAAAGALSRAAVPAVMQALPPARADGLGAGIGLPDAGIAAQALALALLVAVVALGAKGALAAVAAAVIAVLLVARLARTAIGGYTGDVLGAVIQAVEVAVLLAAAGSWR